MPRLGVLLILFLCAAAAIAEPPLLVQATSSRGGLRLETLPGRARVVTGDGERRRLPVRPGETLEEVVELEGGWAAAGVRVDERRRQLVVIVDGAAGIERLPPIPDQIGALRVRPVPMASRRGFLGLAWLEGDSPAAYEVRVSEWNGASWSPPETISPAHRDGQAGLVGAVLRDGRWLLVWSAADGRGSELLWAVGDRGRWAPPRPLAAPNREPDVTPTLVPVSGGALLAWAQGSAAGYRLRSARFRNGWERPRPLGPRVGYAPRFAELAGAGRYLIHRTRTGWAALELAADGRELRRAEVDGGSRDTPVLSAVGGGLALRWGGRRAQPLLWKEWR